VSEETGRRTSSESLGDSPSIGGESANRDTRQLYEFGQYRLDPSERKLLRGNEIVTLTPKAFDTLVLLVRYSGHLLEKDELIRMLWPDTFVEDGSLSNNIFLLRKALGEDPAFIETVPRRGYRFIGAVRRFPDGGPGPREGLRLGSPPPDAPLDLEPRALAVATLPTKARPLSQNRAAAGITVLVVLVLVAAALWLYRSAAGRGPIDSVAVLPFENAGGDPNTEYLSDGIAESLINSLSQLPHLKVMSRDSAFHYRGEVPDVQTVGHKLGVRAVFKGRVAQHGDMLAISAELIDARDNSHIWGQQYIRKPSDIFALQEEIAKEMTAALRVRLTGEEEKRLGKTYTASPEAYENYLKGRYWFNKQTEEGFHKGIEYFERSITKDPTYALGYAGLADCYISLANFGAVSAKEGYSKAREWAQKALKLDDTLVEAHVSLASVKTDYEWDWLEGEKEARRAIELNPSDARARVAHAEVLWTTGKLDESIQETKRALELDPLSINSNDALEFEFFLARQYDQAIEQAAKTLELDPKYISAYYVRGVAYVKKSMYKEAMAEFEKGVAIAADNPSALTGLGYGFAVTGRRADAEKVLARLNELSKREFVSPVWMAKIYSGLGEKDKAFESLERAYEDRSIVSVAYIKTNPMLDPLRSDPRFAELLRRMNL
jgi:TolB-like protein/DNA-binding winged helix-turn-helix (wHTH) protein/Tfp pilus assembly protein PilF